MSQIAIPCALFPDADIVSMAAAHAWPSRSTIKAFAAARSQPCATSLNPYSDPIT